MNTIFSSLTLTTGKALTVVLMAIIVSLIPINCNSALAQTTTELNAFRSNSLSKHNSYRATHRSPSMTTRSSANSTAQAWAQALEGVSWIVLADHVGQVVGLEAGVDRRLAPGHATVAVADPGGFGVRPVGAGIQTQGERTEVEFHDERRE